MVQWHRKQHLDSTTSRNGGDLHISLTRKLIDFLANQISNPNQATSILAQVSKFKDLPPTYQEKDLPSIYLKLEQYLAEEDPVHKFSRAQLRQTVKHDYEPLMELQNFSLIFEASDEQELLLCQLLFKNLILNANIETNSTREPFFNSLAEWIYSIPDVANVQPPFKMEGEIPRNLSEWIKLLSIFSQKFYHYLEKNLGEVKVATIFEKSFRELVENYSHLETFSNIFQFLPDKLLDKSKIEVLNNDQIRDMFLNKIEHLKKANDKISQKEKELRDAQSELEIAENTVLESVQLFTTVLKSVSEGVITIDADGSIILINDRTAEIFGYQEDELIGQNIKILMPKHYRNQHQDGMNRYLRTKESRALGQRIKLEGLKKDKRIFPIELHINETNINGQIYFTAAVQDITEQVRKEAQRSKVVEAQRLAEQRIRYLVEKSQDIIFTLTLDGNFLSINSAFEKIIGAPVDQWLGKPFTQIVDPQDSMAALKAFQKVLQNQEVSAMELRIRPRTNRLMVGEFTLTPQIQNGKMIAVMGIARNITQQKRTREALRISEERYRKLVEISPEAVVVQLNNKIVSINEAGLKMLGAADSRQILNRPLSSFIDSESHDTFRKTIELVQRTAKHQVLKEQKLTASDGREIHVELTIARTFYQGKEAILFLFKEMTPLKEADEALRENEARFQLLLNHNTDAILIADADRFLIEANRAASKLYGLDHDSLLGRNFLQLVPENLRETTAKLLTLLLKDRIELCESAAIRIDGKHLPTQLRARPIQYAGKPAILLVIREISELKNNEQEHQRLIRNFQESQEKLSENQIELQQAQSQVLETQKELEAARQELLDTRSKFLKVQSERLDVRNQQQMMQAKVEELRIELEHTREELQTAQMKIAELGQLIPICKICKNIRDDQEYWEKVQEFSRDPANEVYIQDQGVCTTCARR